MRKETLEQKLLTTIKKYQLIKSGDKLVIGVSGGPDSICLLNILNSLKEKLNIEIYVAHINHMIREVADEETKYVQKFCEGIGIQCFVKKVNILKIAEENKTGTEETGRNVRYDFFNEVAEKINANKIATAHNMNDKVETVLLNIIRGTGTIGLKGIEPIREEKYIRPLIEIERKDIEEYCINNDLNPKIDESNNENEYRRNKIRNIVIPYIKENFNENILGTINRLSEVIKEEDEFINNIVEKEVVRIIINKEENKIILSLKEFNKLDLVIKRRIILYTINKLIGTTIGIEKINIDDIIKLCNNNIGNKYLKPKENIKVLVKNKKIIFTKES